MTISREPHPVMSALWAARYFGMFAGIVFGQIIVLGACSASFFPLEWWGNRNNTGMRDQLSEIWTWVARKLSRTDRWWHAWNLLLPMFAILEAGAVYVLGTYSGIMPELVVGVFCVLLAALLWMHWLRPDIFG